MKKMLGIFFLFVALSGSARAQSNENFFDFVDQRGKYHVYLSLNAHVITKFFSDFGFFRNYTTYVDVSIWINDFDGAKICSIDRHLFSRREHTLDLKTQCKVDLNLEFKTVLSKEKSNFQPTSSLLRQNVSEKDIVTVTTMTDQPSVETDDFFEDTHRPIVLWTSRPLASRFLKVITQEIGR